MTDDLIYAQNALTYHERGYSPIPLPPRAKKFPVEGYTGYAGKDATLDEVRDWCVDRPDANIALRLPDGVIAIDVDAIDLATGEMRAGYHTLAKAMKELGPLPLLGRSSASPETPAHGHFLFRVPPGTHLVENLDARFGPNVDIIQRTHRYLVAPPSIHPATGRPYEWVPNPANPEMISFPPVANLPALPAAWLEALTRAERTDDAEGIEGGSTEEYDAFTDEVKAKVDFHVAAEVDRTLARLENLKTLESGARDEAGRGWHDGIRDYTKYLARLCNAPWTPLLPADLTPRLREAIPHDAGKTLAEGMQMFAAAVDQPGGSDMPSDIAAAVLMSALPKPPPPAEAPPKATDEGPVVTNPFDQREWPYLEGRHADRFRRPSDVVDHMAEALAPVLLRFGGMWMVWLGDRWVRDPDRSQAALLVTSLLGAQPVQTYVNKSGDRKQTPYSVAIAAESNRPAAGVLDKLGSRQVLVSEEPFDSNPNLINTPGGILDLETGKTEPHDPSMRVTGITRASYRPGAAHPDLNRVLGIHDPDTIAYLQLVLGAALTGNPDHRMTLVHGPGGNGKTTLLGSLISAMGDYGFAGRGSDLADITAGKGHKMVSVFEGRRLVLFEELAREGHLDAATIKRLVGGGRQGGDAKYQAHRTWDPTASVIVNSNSLPRISESDAAIHRRLRAIPLNAMVPEDQQDPNIERRLRTERSALEAVFAWAVEGARKFIEAGSVLPTPKSAAAAVADSTTAWFNDFDTTGQFIEAALRESDDPEVWIPLREIYERFEKFWAEERGVYVKPFAPQRLYSELRDRGVAVYEPGQAQKAKRKATTRMLAKQDPNSYTVLSRDEPVTPVRGWTFAENPGHPLHAEDLVAAVNRTNQSS